MMQTLIEILKTLVVLHLAILYLYLVPEPVITAVQMQLLVVDIHSILSSFLETNRYNSFSDTLEHDHV